MVKKWVYGCLFVLILCFIFGNSMLSKEMSMSISQFVAGILGGTPGEAPSDEGHTFVRKLAHFVEFAALGAVSHLFIDSLMRDKCKKYLTVALIGASVPVVDETIQIFSSRGPALGDVWIDMAGYAVGVAVIFAAFICLKAMTGKRDLSQ